MNKHKGRLKNLWERMPEFCAHIETEASIRIDGGNILLALSEATGKDSEDLALDDWDSSKVLETIINTKLVCKLPVILAKVDLEESIIPDHLIRSINEDRKKFKGEIWVVHKNDADPFPSNPHAHNYEKGFTLHLGNGQLYYQKQPSEKISCKELKKLRGLFRTIKMPPLEC